MDSRLRGNDDRLSRDFLLCPHTRRVTHSPVLLPQSSIHIRQPLKARSTRQSSIFPCTSANSSRGVGSRRACGFDCLTEPGLVCLPIAIRPKQSTVLHGAMGKLYEAGEGVSKPHARREPATRPLANKEIFPPVYLNASRPAKTDDPPPSHPQLQPQDPEKHSTASAGISA